MLLAPILIALGTTMTKLGHYDVALSYLEEAYTITAENTVLSKIDAPLPRSELDDAFFAVVSCLAEQGSPYIHTHTIPFSSSTKPTLGFTNGAGKYVECDGKFRTYMNKYHATFTPNDLNLSKLQNNWALVLEKLGDLKGAKMLYLESLSIREAKLGKESPLVAASLANLSKVCIALKELDEAEKYLDRANTIISIVFKKDTPLHLDLIVAKVSLLNARGSFHSFVLPSHVPHWDLITPLLLLLTQANMRPWYQCPAR
jgi:tetratricopeptide (TPR) repeat protein